VTEVSPTDGCRKVGDALAYAAEVHAGQQRKGTSIPYLGHLLTVAALVVEDGGSPDEVAAGLLHDAAEDRGGRARLADIELRFGAAVAGIVAECSDTLEPAKEPWRERKQRYLDHLVRATPGAVRVSLADKVANLRTIVDGFRTHGEPFWLRFDEDADPLWYYGSVLAILRERSSSPLLGELQTLHESLEREVALAPHPLPDTYWVTAGRLLAGDFPGGATRQEASRRLRRLRWCGVSELIDLTCPDECRRSFYLEVLEGDMRHRQFAIEDCTVPTPQRMDEILAAIDECVAAGRVVYLHCAGGIGRTGLVAGCWLVRHGMSGAEAIDHIAMRRAGTPNQSLRSPGTEEQRELVLHWR
jgi:hypothetical protein